MNSVGLIISTICVCLLTCARLKGIITSYLTVRMSSFPFQELMIVMNPFHNMAKYRELQRATKPPLIPFFPIIKKDLTFLYDGNDTNVDGLINFEKLRMLSHQIRVVSKFCEQQIVVSFSCQVICPSSVSLL